MAAMPAAAGPPTVIPVPPSGLSLWQELYKSADHVFSAPFVPYAVLSATIFNSVDPPDTLLNKCKRMVLELPVIMAVMSDKGPDWFSLLKNTQRFVGSLLNCSGLNGLLYGFMGPDAHKLLLRPVWLRMC